MASLIPQAGHTDPRQRPLYQKLMRLTVVIDDPPVVDRRGLRGSHFRQRVWHLVLLPVNHRNDGRLIFYDVTEGS